MELSSIKKLNLEKGDIVVIKVQKIMSNEERKSIIDYMYAKVPNNECIILDGGIELQVLKNYIVNPA